MDAPFEWRLGVALVIETMVIVVERRFHLHTPVKFKMIGAYKHQPGRCPAARRILTVMALNSPRLWKKVKLALLQAASPQPSVSLQSERETWPQPKHPYQQYAVFSFRHHGKIWK